MKDSTIVLIIIAIMSPIAYAVYVGFNPSPQQKAQDAKYDEEAKWENDTMTLAHSTNDTATLKQIYTNALARGADPNCNVSWTCDGLGELYHYAFAKYEALKQ